MSQTGTQYVSEAHAQKQAFATDQLPASFVSNVEARLESIHSLIQGSTGRLQAILDRAYGASLTEAGKNAGVRPMPSGMVGSINTRMDDMQDTLELQRSLIGRLESLA